LVVCKQFHSENNCTIEAYSIFTNASIKRLFMQESMHWAR